MSEIKTTLVNDGQIAIVTINRPKKFNSLTWENFADLKNEVEKIGKHGSDVRCIVLTGEGKHFTSGLDLVAAMKLQEAKGAGGDPARSAFHFFDILAPL